MSPCLTPGGPFGEMMLHEEMVIAINGPILVHCDSKPKVKVKEIPLKKVIHIFSCIRKLSRTDLLTGRIQRKDLATLSGVQKTS